MLQNKKIISIAIISLFILSAFTTVPLSLAQGEYITVYPSSVSPGQTVYVRGYNFPAGETVEIYCDEVDENHHLGSAVVNSFGRFYFSFVMQSNYPGPCNVIAKWDSSQVSEDFTLRYTNPLDERLIDLINGLSTGAGNIEDKIDDIEAKLDTIMIPKLDQILGQFPLIHDHLNLVRDEILAQFPFIHTHLDSVKDQIMVEFSLIHTHLDLMRTEILATITTAISTHDSEIKALIGTPVVNLASDIAAIEGKLDGTVPSLITTINDKLGTITSYHGWTDFAGALGDIKDEIIIINGMIGSATTGPTTIMGKLEELKSWSDITFVNLMVMDTKLNLIEDELTTAMWNTGGWANLAAALDDIKDDIDDLDSWFGTGGKYSNTEQIISGGGVVTATQANQGHIWSWNDGYLRVCKITITLSTSDIDYAWDVLGNEWLDIFYLVGPTGSEVWDYQRVVVGADITATYEIATYRIDLYAGVPLDETLPGDITLDGGDGFTVYFSYVIEYPP